MLIINTVVVLIALLLDCCWAFQASMVRARYGFGGDMKDPRRNLILLSSYEDTFFDAMGQQNNWYDMEGCSVLLPPSEQVVPRAIVHFLGGFVAGSAAPLAYGRTLTSLAGAGYLVVVSPIPALQTNHSNIAASVAQTFTQCYENQLLRLMGDREEALKVPIVGLSHSLGGKIMALMASRKEDRRKVPPRVGNIFLAFNNYGFQQSMEMSQTQAAQFDPKMKEAVDVINTPEVQNLVDMAKEVSNAPSAVGDMLFGAFGNMAAAALETAGARNGDGAQRMNDDERERFGKAVAGRIKDVMGKQVDAVSQQVTDKISEVMELEFDPSPEQTFALIKDGYNVQSNVLIRFCDDEIDQSHQLEAALNLRGGCEVELMTMAGSHITPISLVPEGTSQAEGFESDFSTRTSGGSRRRRRLGNVEELRARGLYSDEDDMDMDMEEEEASALDSLNKELMRQINRLVMETGRRTPTRYRLPPVSPERADQ